MNKKILAVLVAVVLAAAVVLGIYKYQQARVKDILDQVVIPEIQKSFEQSTGRKAVVRYDKARMEGFSLKVSNISLAAEGAPALSVGVEDLSLDCAPLKFVFGMIQAQAQANKITIQSSDTQVLVESATAENAVFVGTHDLTLPRLIFAKIGIKSGKEEQAETNINHITLDDITSRLKPDQRSYEFAVARTDMVGDDFQVKLGKFGGEAPVSQEAQGMWRQGKYSVLLDSVEVIYKNQQVMLCKDLSSSTLADENKMVETTAVKSIAFSPPKDDQSRYSAIMAAMGFEKLDLSFSETTELDRQQDTITLKDYSISSGDLGSLRLTISATGIKPFLDKGQNINPLELLDKLALVSFSLEYRDASLVPRLLKMAAQLSNTSEEEVRQTFRQNLLTLAEAYRQESAELSELILKLAPMLDKQQSFCLKTGNEKPIFAGQFLFAGWQGSLKMAKPEAGPCQ